jgi:pSer/pThr/pTyr-binding forkhead associated (FHA) protein
MHVSRRHFSVAPVQGGYLLRDESANGTLVNGSRVVGTYLLGAADVLRLDEEELRFEVDGIASPEPSAQAATTTLLDLSCVRATAEPGGKRDQSPPRAALEIVRGRFAGAWFDVDRPVCAIGRGPQNDVRIRDESVSSNHATLLRKGRNWFVVDLRSANGTFVDSSRVAGEREIASGARLKLGAVELVFRALDGTGDVTIEMKRRESWMRRLLKPFKRAGTREAGRGAGEGNRE